MCRQVYNDAYLHTARLSYFGLLFFRYTLFEQQSSVRAPKYLPNSGLWCNCFSPDEGVALTQSHSHLTYLTGLSSCFCCTSFAERRRGHLENRALQHQTPKSRTNSSLKLKILLLRSQPTPSSVACPTRCCYFVFLEKYLWLL